MGTKHIEIEVAGDLYRAGYGCDGQEIIGESFYVVATYPSGRRIRHNQSFPGIIPEGYTDDGDRAFNYRGEEAKAEAEALRARIEAAVLQGRALDMAHWDHARPVYGSDEYISTGAELDEIALERKEAEEERFR